MAIDRVVLRAVISLSVVCGPQPSVFELPASASGQPAGVGPSVLGRPGQFGAGPEAWQNERNPAVGGDVAVEFALSQVGKPYVYGAAGPYGYDCSGLALASWRVAGVELPRTASAQFYAGSHVPLGQLQPGDLIFWASDVTDPATIYHVAISLGGDRTVQATQTGQPVEVVPLWPIGLVPLATRP
jgi:cell wall-associated NlpC family hydrolase